MNPAHRTSLLISALEIELGVFALAYAPWPFVLYAQAAVYTPGGAISAAIHLGDCRWAAYDTI